MASQPLSSHILLTTYYAPKLTILDRGEGRKMNTCCTAGGGGRGGRGEVGERYFQFTQMVNMEIGSDSPPAESTFIMLR